MATDPTFQMIVDDVFTIKGRGTIVTGRVGRGMLKIGDVIHLTGAAGVRKTVVKGLETFRKQVTEVQVGDNIGVLLDGISKDDIQPGDLVGP